LEDTVSDKSSNFLENFENDHKHHFTAKEKEKENDKRDEILIKCK